MAASKSVRSERRGLRPLLILMISGSLSGAPLIGGALMNRAHSNASTTAPISGNNRLRTVGASADVSVTKVGPSNPVGPGAWVNYAITVHNAGPSNALGVTLTDTVPAWSFGPAAITSLSDPANWSCSERPWMTAPNGLVTCITSSLAPGGSVVIGLAMQVDPGVPLGWTLSNTVSVTWNTADSSPGSGTATATTTRGDASADLSITNTAAGTVIAGTNLSYDITVANAGPDFLLGAVVTDILPAGTTYVSLSPPAGLSPADWTCATPPVGGTGTVTCTVNLSAVRSTSFTLTVAVNPSLSAGTNLSNTASVSAATAPGSPVPDPVPGNNSATATTAVALPSTAVPALSMEALAMLAALLAAVGAVTLRR